MLSNTLDNTALVLAIPAFLKILVILVAAVVVVCIIDIAWHIRRCKKEAESTTDNTGAINEQLHDLKDSLRRIEEQLKQQKEDPRD